MKVVAIILARMGSQRLPGKGLKLIQNKPLLSHTIERLQLSKKVDKIILATSDSVEDNPLETFAEQEGITCYRGSLDNVAERFLNAGLTESADYLVRINGDNVFVDHLLLDSMLEVTLRGYDFVSNVQERTFPSGMSIEIVSLALYKTLFSKFSKDEHFEHVTLYLYQNLNEIRHNFFKNKSVRIPQGMNLAVDTSYDFKLVTRMLDELGTGYGKTELKEIVKVYKNVKDKMNFDGKHGPLLIAEIGGNHEGDFEYAKKLTELAIESDSDFIKFQIYSGDTLVNKHVCPVRNKHFKKFELSKEHYIELAKKVKDSGKKFMASIWDSKMIDWVDEYNPIYKIGSGDLLAYPLIKKMAETGKPIIISTGLASEDEVINTVNFIRQCNSKYEDSDFLAVLQCTSMYPIPDSDANLNVMSRLKQLTGTTVGFSDHTEGSYGLEVAVAMGAQVLEYHFTDSRENKSFRDHKVSLIKDEVLELIEKIKRIKQLQGSPIKKPTAIEIDNGHVESFRRGVYLKYDLPKGHVIQEEDLIILRPSPGLSSSHFYDIAGKTLSRSIKAFEVLQKTDIYEL